MSLSPVQQQLMEALAAKILGEDKGMQVMPFYITGFLDSLLFGVALSQLFSYWHFVKTDKKYIVAIVCISMLCALGTTLCILLWMQDLFVWGFGTYLTFTKVASWIGRYEAINVAATLTVQGFYIDRACRLYKHWWPALVISPFALGAAASGIAFVHLGYLQHEYVTPELLESRLIKSLAYSLLGFTFAADCFITTCIVVGLYRLRTGWTHTDSTLRRLIIQCFEAQIPALTIQLIAFVLWNQVYQVGLPFVMNQTKVYVLGLLITLNLRSRVNTATNVSYPSAGLDKTSQSGSYQMSSLERSSKDDGGDKNVHATLAPVDTPHPGSSDWLHTYASTEHLRSGHTNPV